MRSLPMLVAIIVILHLHRQPDPTGDNIKPGECTPDCGDATDMQPSDKLAPETDTVDDAAINILNRKIYNNETRVIRTTTTI